MTARAALYSLLSSDTQLASLGVTSVYGSGGVDTPADEMFIIVRWELFNQQFGHHGPSSVLIWVHDKMQTYDRIDRVIARVTDIVNGAVQVGDANGWTLVQAKSGDVSGDLYDDAFGTCARYLTVAVSSRYNGS